MWPRALKFPNILISLLCEEKYCEENYWSGLKYASLLYHLEKRKEVLLLCTSFVSAHCTAV